MVDGVEVDDEDVVGVVEVVTGMNSVGGGATVVDVDVVVFSSWNLAYESGVCISRPSSVSQAVSTVDGRGERQARKSTSSHGARA